MKSSVAAVLLLAVAGVQLAAAWQGCRDVITGETQAVGDKCATAQCVDHTQGRVGMITKVNVYLDNGCIVGVKPTYGFDARNARLIGKQRGTEKDIRLRKGEVINKLEVTANGCIKYLKLTTNKGASVALGTAGTVQTFNAPTGDSYLYAFKGCIGSSGCATALGSLVAVWARDDCGSVATTAAVPPLKPRPTPRPKPAPVPKPEPAPTPVTEGPTVLTSAAEPVPNPDVVAWP